MKRILKKPIIKLIKILFLYRGLVKIKRLFEKESMDLSYYRMFNRFIKYMFSGKVKFCFVHEKNQVIKEAKIFHSYLINSNIKFEDDIFFYSPDFFIIPITNYTESDKMVTIGNITVNYEYLLNNGIYGIESDIKKIIEREKSKNDFYNAILIVLDGIKKYVDRVKELERREGKIQSFLRDVPLNKARTFKDALQSILFLNSLIWTYDGYLVGLGRLDKLLFEYFQRDINNGTITRKEALEMLKRFLILLHKDYVYKSNTIKGDTGQVIVLGGEERYLELTELFMDAFLELKIPDPKIVLRVFNGMSKKIWEKSISIISSGVGYPLFSNDNKVIKSMISFGYNEEDAYNYSVSACWEPLIEGCSFDQNNVGQIIFTDSLSELIKRDEKFENYESFEKMYLLFLKNQVKGLVEKINMLRYKPNPFLSIFIRDCVEKGKDLSEGGARYNNYGILTLGLSNTVNSLENIKKIFLEKKDPKDAISYIRSIVFKNYEGNKELIKEFKNKLNIFGKYDEEGINLSNLLIETCNEVLKDKFNYLGGKYKIGYSSPNFVNSGKDVEATLDGRVKGEPLDVHISITNSNSELTEFFVFSSQLNYLNCFNGGVSDIIIEKDKIK
ncbi:MAG: pyruvate formate lyase family protein, partial [Elusimicrobiales bacterium]